MGTPYSAPNMTATGRRGVARLERLRTARRDHALLRGQFRRHADGSGRGYTVSVTVTDSQGATASQSYTLTVSAGRR